MGAYKNFCIEVAEAGKCPVSLETLGYLAGVECERSIDWIEHCEYDWRNRDGLLITDDCISVRSARRLVAEGLANDEIACFVEDFAWLAPATPDVDQCSDCRRLMPVGRPTNRHGERFCEECA